MKARALVTAALGVVFAFTALTGAAFAGKPDDPGKSEQAPGQVKKAEQAPVPAAPAPAAQPSSESKGNSGSAPGQVKKAENAPAATSSKGKSASAPGKTKTGKAASPSKGKSAQAKSSQAGIQQQGEGQLRTAQKKVLICHSTGSATNPFVVISVSVNALKSGHDQLGTREAVLSEMATQPGRRTAEVHGGRTDIILGPSSPGRIENKAELEAQCAQQAGIQRLSSPPEQPAPAALPTPDKKPTPQPTAQAAQPAAQPQPEVGEVAGVQAVIEQPAAPAPQQQPAGGVLGALGSVGQAELPFTGLPLWIAGLIGIALVSAGLGARRAMR